MKDNFDSDAFNTDFNDRVEKFEEYFNDPAREHKIFTELGFTYVDDGCDGFCPECEQKNLCKVYPELKEEWDNILYKEKYLRG